MLEGNLGEDQEQEIKQVFKGIQKVAVHCVV